MKKVSIIITTHEGNPFLEDAVFSAHHQSLRNIDVIVVKDDGSGVAASTNRGVAQTDSEYVMRLDGDDTLHPDCCLVMAAYLDAHEAVAAVYSDYKVFDSDGVGPTFTQPAAPHPACMMIRRSVFNALGGLDANLRHQEGYEFWFRLSRGYNTYHMTISLWYYRQHDGQQSNQWNERMALREQIKEQHGTAGPKVLTVIPARANSKRLPHKNLMTLNHQTLVGRAIATAKKSGHDMQIAVSTEDHDIAVIAKAAGVAIIDRPGHLAEDHVNLIEVARHAMFQSDHADIIVSLQPSSPFISADALDAGLTRIMDDDEIDSVVSVSRIIGTHPYRAYRLNNSGRVVQMFEEAEMYMQTQDFPPMYGFTSGFYIRRRKLLEEWDWNSWALGACAGVVVPPDQAVDINTEMDMWLAQAIISHRGEL